MGGLSGTYLHCMSQVLLEVLHFCVQEISKSAPPAACGWGAGSLKENAAAGLAIEGHLKRDCRQAVL